MKNKSRFNHDDDPMWLTEKSLTVFPSKIFLNSHFELMKKFDRNSK